MNQFRNYIFEMSEKEKLEIIEGYEKLEETGNIGESSIRRHAEIILRANGNRGSITIIMKDLAVECLRHFAYKYLNSDVQQ